MDRSLVLAIGISVLASVAFAAQSYESLQRVTVSQDGAEYSRTAHYVEDGYDNTRSAKFAEDGYDSTRSAKFAEDGYDRTNGHRLS